MELMKLPTSGNKILAELIEEDSKHEVMLSSLGESLPELNRGISLFGKAQTQFMDNQLTVTHLTPLRNLRQILAQFNKTFDAYRENDIRCRKRQVEIDILQVKLEKETDELEKELIALDIESKMNELFISKKLVSGAIKEMTNYNEQYKAIKAAKDIGEFTERDVEEEEPIYHIAKAFQQGMCAARSNGGRIDNGNHIYMENLGINGAMAQAHLNDFFAKEQAMIKNKVAPSFEMYLEFIGDMCTIFGESYKVMAKYKGMTGTVTDLALLE